MASETGGEKQSVLKPVYGVISPKFWPDVRLTLSTEGKLIANHLITGRHANRIGLFEVSLPGAADELNMDVKKYEKHFGPSVVSLGWEYDEEARVLWIPSWWKYNHPQNPRHMMGSLRDLTAVPDSYLIPKWAGHVIHVRAVYREQFHALVQPRLAMLAGGDQLELPFIAPTVEVRALPEPVGFTPEVEMIYAYGVKIFKETLGRKWPTDKDKKGIAAQKDAIRLLLDRDGADGQEVLKVLDFLPTDKQTTPKGQWSGWGNACESFLGLRRKCKDGETKYQHIVSEMGRAGPGAPSANSWK